ncbi:permease prefix domain 1-containing protein [Paenibacillus campinasensis]|uniref:DUF1129 family protein n=1 Tax=Paenibacillus campinasensis TaxID=66347 RepID=A0A268EPC8_9BACL|nr:permease prefix domain 1-containing protein [Paenibacillus campinasensis]PAD74980.1 hypothetical protein CHH67_17020 [Paenibacillus campinasensis]
MTDRNDLNLFVDRLFANKRKTKAVMELKQEILSNLEAKVADCMSSGMDYQEAISQAIRDLDDIDSIIDDKQTVYIHRYRYDVMQGALLYVFIAWIVTIPARLTLSGVMVNTLFMVLGIAGGVLLLTMLQKGFPSSAEIDQVDTGKIGRMIRRVWILWGLFAIVITGYSLLIKFGSDLWFGRQVGFSGPYDFYETMLQLVLPLTTIIIPLATRKAGQYITKYEVKQS